MSVKLKKDDFFKIFENVHSRLDSVKAKQDVNFNCIETVAQKLTDLQKQLRSLSDEMKRTRAAIESEPVLLVGDAVRCETIEIWTEIIARAAAAAVDLTRLEAFEKCPILTVIHDDGGPGLALKSLGLCRSFTFDGKNCYFYSHDEFIEKLINEVNRGAI